MARLKFHDVIKLEGELHRVALVNESRALCVPITKRVREIAPQTGDHAGMVVKISVQQPGKSICTDADVEIVGTWDPAQNKMRMI